VGTSDWPTEAKSMQVAEEETGPPEGAFTFAEDDLCTWVSEDEVAEFVAAEFAWEGTVVLDPSSGGDGCGWRLTSTDDDVVFDVGAAAARWSLFGPDNTPIGLGEVEVVDFDEEAGTVDDVDTGVSGHPSLSDGVVVINGGWGNYAFWVPPIDECLELFVSVEPVVPEGELEARTFGVADRFLQELGWLG